jgi:signal transduction histidine kinase/DNA-binding response OmpR family regulator
MFKTHWKNTLVLLIACSVMSLAFMAKPFAYEIVEDAHEELTNVYIQQLRLERNIYALPKESLSLENKELLQSITQLNAQFQAHAKNLRATMNTSTPHIGRLTNTQEIFSTNITEANHRLTELSSIYTALLQLVSNPPQMNHFDAIQSLTSLATSASTQLGALHHNIDALDDILHEEKKSYNTILLYCCMFLALYMLYFMLKLHKTSKELERSRDQLEEAVRLRTEALEQQNIALGDAREHALEAVRLKSDFLATMSHEIRTPMNGIIGMTQLLKETRMTPKQEQYVHTLLASGEALLELINDILDFSKIESGKMEIESKPFQLEDMIEDVVDVLAERAREKGLELIVRFPSHLPRWVEGDKGRIRQIFYNLIGNAIKFTDSGHVQVFIALDKDTLPNEHGVMMHFCVEDTGIGIPKDKLNYIFEKFSQADSSTTRKFGGTGLGLAICRELTAMMGGRIWVESEQDQGSQFHFTLRLQLATNAPEISAAPTYPELQGCKILVVDDVRENIQMLCDVLSSHGMQAQGALSGHEATDMLRAAYHARQPFDMAVIDYAMPHMDGVSLARTIKSHSELAATPLIMVATESGNAYSLRFREAGFAAYIMKPFRTRSILSTMQDVWVSLQQHKPMPLSRDEFSTKNIQTTLKPFVGVKTLLVEDNKVNQEVAQKLLNKLGCEVIVADNGSIAIEKVKQSTYDVIFMDCQMPEMDGFEATSIIRHQQLTCAPIIALTANAMRGDKERCLEAGMDDYLSKPVHLEQLQLMLEKWVKEKHTDKDTDMLLAPQPIPTAPATPEHPKDTAVTLCAKTLEYLHQMVGNSFDSILEHYVQGSENSVATIQQALSNQDYTALMRAAHSLKSSSAQLGAMELSAIAKELEALSRTILPDDDDLRITIAELTEKLAYTHRQTLIALKNHTHSNDAISSAEAS